jgi:hypothetical protein
MWQLRDTFPPTRTPVAAKARWPPFLQLRRHSRPPAPIKLSQAAGRAGGRDNPHGCRSCGHGALGLMVKTLGPTTLAAVGLWPPVITALDEFAGRQSCPIGEGSVAAKASWPPALHFRQVSPPTRPFLSLPAHVGRLCRSLGGIPTRPPPEAELSCRAGGRESQARQRLGCGQGALAAIAGARIDVSAAWPPNGPALRQIVTDVL